MSNYIQLLACNTDLGSCCSDFSIVYILSTAHKILSFIQLIVPILLIAVSSYELTRIVFQPDNAKLKKKIINQYLAALFVFAVPILVDVVLGILPDSMSLSSCWEQAQVANEVSRSQGYTYIPVYDSQKNSLLTNPDDYAKGEKKDSSSNVSSGSGNGSATGKAIVAYAKSFVGQRYLYGGSWNGEKPYTPTDCSGFVRGVFHHFGISLQRTSSAQWEDSGKYTLVTGEIKAGDVVMYNGHVGILTGNGNEIVHAKSTKSGVVIDPDYRKCSSHAIRGIVRMNGVN